MIDCQSPLMRVAVGFVSSVKLHWIFKIVSLAFGGLPVVTEAPEAEKVLFKGSLLLTTTGCKL